jgi:SP family xylose:H+ symportor-like MFS transporter
MNKSYNSTYIVGITLVATLGGLLFGYDTAVISGAEKAIQAYLIQPLGLGTFAHGASISSALIGCIIGGMISGFLSNRLGRKKSLLLAGFLFFTSAMGSAYPEFIFFVKDEPTMGLLFMFNFYRIWGGIGVGLASAVCPTYIGEIAPAEIRGRLVAFNQFAIIFGMLVVYFVNWGIANGQTIAWINDLGWRYMFCSEAIPAGLFFILLFFVPETPRYLALIRQESKALTVLEKINVTKERAKHILDEITSTVSEVTKKKIFSYGKKVIVIGILLSVFQQISGINVVLYFAPRIFESMNVTRDASLFQTVIMGFVNVMFTVVAILTVDKWGRKPLLITGSIGMAVGMIAIAILSYYNIISILTLVFIIIYSASFMMSWGPICWVYISELFPNKIRGQAVAIAVACQWAANFLISSTFPKLMDISSAFAYGLYGSMAIVSAIFVWKMVPETKGKSLEAIQKIWKK